MRLTQDESCCSASSEHDDDPTEYLTDSSNEEASTPAPPTLHTTNSFYHSQTSTTIQTTLTTRTTTKCTKWSRGSTFSGIPSLHNSGSRVWWLGFTLDIWIASRSWPSSNIMEKPTNRKLNVDQVHRILVSEQKYQQFVMVVWASSDLHTCIQKINNHWTRFSDPVDEFTYTIAMLIQIVTSSKLQRFWRIRAFCI